MPKIIITDLTEEEMAEDRGYDHASAEPSQPAPQPAGTERLVLSQSMITAFGPADDQCYVFDIAPSPDGSLLAASLSNNKIKLYRRGAASIEHYLDLAGHDGQVSALAFALASSPTTLMSSSADGTVKGWDTRSGQQVLRLAAHGQELWSFAVGGAGDALLAAGGNSEGGVDGLVCVFDVTKGPDEEEGMAGVLSVGSSIARMGFFGHSLENLWALTSTEDLSTWTWADATLLASLQDTRGLCAAAAAAAGPPASALSEQVDYLIGCHWDAARDSLWLLAGTATGAAGVFPCAGGAVSVAGAPPLGPPVAVAVVRLPGDLDEASTSPLQSPLSLIDEALAAVVLCTDFLLPTPTAQGGHTEVVRVLQVAGAPDGTLRAYSGGEDSRICVWTPPSSAEAVAPALKQPHQSSAGGVTGAQCGGSGEARRRPRA